VQLSNIFQNIINKFWYNYAKKGIKWKNY
jgi:hypothetical protein